MGRTPSRERKQKKSKKQKYRRDGDREDRKYTSDKYSNSLSPRSNSKRKSKDKMRDKDRERERERERRNQQRQRKEYRQKKFSEVKERSLQRGKQVKRYSRERSREKQRRREQEEEEMRVKQRRLAMARMLVLDETALNIIDNNDEQQKQEPPQQKPMVVEPPKAPEVVAPKKKSRWEKSGTNDNELIIPMIVEAKASITPVKPIEAKVQQKSSKNNLQLDAPEEQNQLKAAESIDVEEQQRLKNQPANDNEEDQLDAYMKQIEGAAVPQRELTQVGKQTSISYEDIVTIRAPILPHSKMIVEQQQDTDKFKDQFMKAFEKLIPGDTVAEKQPQQQPDATADIIESDLQEQQDQAAEDDDDAFLDKQKKLAERKQYNQIDHSKIHYEEVRFNLYRQSEEIKALTKQEVDKYRKEAGDIKVRGKDVLNPVFNWYQCGLSDKVLEVIQQRKYKKPFPIQAQSFPLMMSGRDVIGIAETGSGKTMAYMIPVIRHIENQKRVQEGQGPIALIMTPTRELARQVYAEFKAFCKPLGIRVISVYGGLVMQNQLSDLKKGAEIIICTPGRMIDVLTLNNGRITNLRRVTMIVIDEADRMFDLGFEPQITKLMNNVRPVRQTVMFSATFPKNVESLAKRILKKPVEIVVGSRGQACVNIEQIIQVREQTSKFWRLLEILGHWNSKGSILIFVDKKTEVDFLFKQLLAYGYHSLPLHSGMDATDREFNVHDFRRGVRNIMVATSVCSRGLDIKNIVLVVNFKCPDHLEDYIHRIGRTGRAGNKGTAITFITPEEEMYSVDMIKALEMADAPVPQELRKLEETYLSKLKKGQAKRMKNKNRRGAGYQFNEDEEDNDQMYKDIIKKQFKSQGLERLDDSDDEDLEKQKKREEDKRGRSDKEKAVQALKDPELKQKLLIETAKALNEAISDGTPMTTEKIIKLAVEKLKQEATKHVIIRTAQEGQQRVLQIIDEIEKTNPNGPTFSYDFEINDYPLSARSKVTSPQFLYQIKELTNCNVSSRGQYYQMGKKVPHGSRKLYLHIQGQNKSHVSVAYKEIKRRLQQESAENYQGQLAIKYGMP